MNRNVEAKKHTHGLDASLRRERTRRRRRLRIELLEARRLLAADWELLGPEIDGEAAGDWSGNATSLSADGRTLAIGAPLNDSGGSDAGHALVYG